MRIPGFELKEPLDPRPVSFGLTGTVTGLAFGLLGAFGGVNAQGGTNVILGYALGGLITGLIIGTGLPLFRQRVVAGVIVSAAAACGLPFVFWGLGEAVPVEGVVLLAVLCGALYAVLLWDYNG